MANFNTYLEEMILSASGWRGIFASSQDEQDSTEEILDEHKYLVALAAQAFSQYIKEKTSKKYTLIVGRDSRPTGKVISDVMIKTILAFDIDVKYIGIVAAPEIMAYAKMFDGFVYISASHNPIGHNGIKFGLSDGGVIPGDEAAKLIKRFKELCLSDNSKEEAKHFLSSSNAEQLQNVYSNEAKYKKESYETYLEFSKLVISGENNIDKQFSFFENIKNSVCEKPLTIVCDMNGSARTKTIDKDFFNNLGINFVDFNNIPGRIVHEIIPEGDNLKHCAKKIEELQTLGHKEALLGYMPDCDGDRGNIVFWNERKNKAEILQAQEVFALSVLSEFAYAVYRTENLKELKLGVSVNGATSMRIDEIASAFNAKVFKAEVGEANVVNCAREKREEGYSVPIMGEGSNGGNITHPAAVRDPINTLFALIKLLTIRTSDNKKGLFELWCINSNQESKFNEDFGLVDIMDTLPQYLTTGVSDARALLKINTRNHFQLKESFQLEFEKEWSLRKDYLNKTYGIVRWQAASTVGTKEILGVSNFRDSGTGGLKIRFFNEKDDVIATLWMRGSGTEPVFRIMCDVKDNNILLEKDLLAWQTKLLENADKI